MKAKYSYKFKDATFFSTSEIVNLMTNAGYSNFQFKQTLFDDENPFRIEDGYTGGSFVVIKVLNETNILHCIQNQYYHNMSLKKPLL